MLLVLSQLEFDQFLRRDLVFGEILVTGCATFRWPYLQTRNSLKILTVVKYKISLKFSALYQISVKFCIGEKNYQT